MKDHQWRIDIRKSNYVGSVEEAIVIAELLRKARKCDIFRGQVQRYPLVPKIFRPGVDYKQAVNRLNQFCSWVHSQQELSSIHNQEDAILCIAQHYDIPTPLLDFSYRPEVAGFFASYISKPELIKKMDSYACIICADSDYLKQSWKGEYDRSLSEKRHPQVRIIETDVNNLWRLHAQDGLFIEVNVAPELLELVSNFIRLIFPLTPSFADNKINKYFPANKSHLEILLDQYFLVETCPEREKRFVELCNGNIIDCRGGPSGDQSSFIGQSFPPAHISWNHENLAQWMQEPSEEYLFGSRRRTFRLRSNMTESVSVRFDKIAGTILNYIRKENFRTFQDVAWNIVDENGKKLELYYPEDDYPIQDVSTGVRLIFDGMRLKPFSDIDIAHAIACYVIISTSPRTSFEMEDIWGKMIVIEFDDGNVRLQGVCGVEQLQDAIRADFGDFLTENKAASYLENGLYTALNVLIDPRRLFDFDRLSSVFARQIIPTSVGIQSERDVFVFNPAKLRVLGYA